MTKLEQARRKAGLTATTAAAIFGYSYPQYRNIEKGKTSLQLVEGFVAMAKEIEVPIEELL